MAKKNTVQAQVAETQTQTPTPKQEAALNRLAEYKAKIAANKAARVAARMAAVKFISPEVLAQVSAQRGHFGVIAKAVGKGGTPEEIAGRASQAGIKTKRDVTLLVLAYIGLWKKLGLVITQ